LRNDGSEVKSVVAALLAFNKVIMMTMMDGVIDSSFLFHSRRIVCGQEE